MPQIICFKIDNAKDFIGHKLNEIVPFNFSSFDFNPSSPNIIVNYPSQLIVHPRVRVLASNQIPHGNQKDLINNKYISTKKNILLSKAMNLDLMAIINLSKLA